MKNHPVLSLKNLTIHRNETRILQPLSWNVAHGEHWIVSGMRSAVGVESLEMSEVVGSGIHENRWRIVEDRQ